MSKKLISINKNSKIKYLRGAFKIDGDTWKIHITVSHGGVYVITPVHSWQSYQLDNQYVWPGYAPMSITSEHWLYEHCKQWVNHQELLNYNKSINAALKKLD